MGNETLILTTKIF